MSTFAIKEILAWTGGMLHVPGSGNAAQAFPAADAAAFPDVGISSFSIDTRTIEPGSVYVAIRGEHHDGHDFVRDAAARGAVLCIVDTEQEGLAIAQIVVPDTLAALQSCAKSYRETLNIPIVGITGSNGKTTTKNFVAAVLSKKYEVAYTKGSFNNHIGLPLSLLSIRPETEAAVMEFGTNHPGEMRRLLDLAQPTIGIITNIGVAHIEYFGTSDAIADEKGNLARFIGERQGKSGIVVTPADGAYFPYFTSITNAQIIGVSALDPDAVGFGRLINTHGLLPQHMIIDALLAREVGRQLGVPEADMIEAIISMPREEGRFIQKKAGQYDIIDDTYNGNPDSVCAAINALGTMYGSRRKIVALGALGELGGYAEAGYRRILESANAAGVKILVLVNIPFLNDASSLAAFPGVEVVHLDNNAACAEFIKKSWKEGDIILLKGSKSAVMKEVIGMLEK